MSRTIIFFLSLWSLLFLFYFINEINVPFYSSYSQIILIPNKSVLGILIASQLAFAIPLIILQYNNKRNKFLFFLFAICFCFAFVLLVYFNGRASWVAFLVSIIYIANSKNVISNKFKKSFYVLTLILIISLFFYKTDSSKGRLLICKISTKIFTDNPLLGVGFGNFKASYNNYQADYFVNHGIETKEALLADNTYFAFNDYYQFLIENGIVGFTILVIIAFLFYKKIWKAKINETQMPLATAAKASIICISVAALFSYPLQILPITFQFVFCISVLIFLAIDNSSTITKNRKIFNKLNAAFLILLFITYAAFQINYKNKSAEALELSRAGYKLKAVKAYKELNGSYFNDGNDVFLYARELYNVGQVTRAKEVLNIAKTKISFNEVYKFSAALEMELKNYKNAEADLKKVVFMIPNRMQPRYNLMEFYLTQKDTANATYWANSIKNMPVKVPSETTRSIQQKVKLFLTK
jgi:O-antigen polymerase